MRKWTRLASAFALVFGVVTDALAQSPNNRMDRDIERYHAAQQAAAR